MWVTRTCFLSHCSKKGCLCVSKHPNLLFMCVGMTAWWFSKSCCVCLYCNVSAEIPSTWGKRKPSLPPSFFPLLLAEGFWLLFLMFLPACLPVTKWFPSAVGSQHKSHSPGPFPLVILCGIILGLQIFVMPLSIYPVPQLLFCALHKGKNSLCYTQYFISATMQLTHNQLCVSVCVCCWGRSHISEADLKLAI